LPQRQKRARKGHISNAKAFQMASNSNDNFILNPAQINNFDRQFRKALSNILGVDKDNHAEMAKELCARWLDPKPEAVFLAIINYPYQTLSTPLYRDFFLKLPRVLRRSPQGLYGAEIAKAHARLQATASASSPSGSNHLFELAGYKVEMQGVQIEDFNRRIDKALQTRFKTPDVQTLAQNVQSEMAERLLDIKESYIRTNGSKEPKALAYYNDFLANPYEHLSSNPLLFIFLPYILRVSPAGLYGETFAQIHRNVSERFKREASYIFSSTPRPAAPAEPKTAAPAESKPNPPPARKQALPVLPPLPEDSKPLEGFDLFDRYPMLRERLAEKQITTFGALTAAMKKQISISPRRIFDLLEGRENTVQRAGPRTSTPNLVFIAMCGAAEMGAHEVITAASQTAASPEPA
jgi:hypothetical protein